MRLCHVVGIGKEDDIGVRVEAVVPANLPHGRSIQIRLGETKNSQDGHEADEFRQHQPADGQSRDSGPFSMEDVVSELPVGVKDAHFVDCLFYRE